MSIEHEVVRAEVLAKLRAVEPWYGPEHQIVVGLCSDPKAPICVEVSRNGRHWPLVMGSLAKLGPGAGSGRSNYWWRRRAKDAAQDVVDLLEGRDPLVRQPSACGDQERTDVAAEPLS